MQSGFNKQCAYVTIFYGVFFFFGQKNAIKAKTALFEVSLSVHLLPHLRHETFQTDAFTGEEAFRGRIHTLKAILCLLSSCCRAVGTFCTYLHCDAGLPLGL